jgi:hypothetical protein
MNPVQIETVPATSKNGHCLLVKMPDNRHFFTEIDNLPQLIEFSKSQNAEVSVVKPRQEVKLLNLSDFAKSLCDPNYNLINPQYDLIEQQIGLMNAGKTPRQRLLAQAQEIRTYIESSVLSGKSISLQNLEEKFEEYNLGEAAIRKHMTFVRMKLAKSGKAVDKIGIGTYELHKD